MQGKKMMNKAVLFLLTILITLNCGKNKKRSENDKIIQDSWCWISNNNYRVFIENISEYNNYQSYVIQNLDHGLTEVINTLESCKNIYSLEIGYCIFDEEIIDFSSLSTIKKLTITYCSLKEMPMSIQYLPNLEYLNLSNNKITFLPDTLSFGKLVYLDLSFNKINEVPTSIYKLKNLKDINFQNNQISNINPLISKLEKLKYLTIYGNNIEEKELIKLDSILPSVKIINELIIE